MNKERKILEIVSGSNLYGTNTPESDKDYLGIFLPPKKQILGLEKCKEINLSTIDKDSSGKNTKDAIDKKLYEFRNFITLALNNNPNIMEILFVNKENIIYIDEFGEALLNIKHLFPSKQLISRFIGYASAQKHKMIIKTEKYNILEYAYSWLKHLDDKKVLVELLNDDKNYFRPNGKVNEGTKCFIKKGNHIHVGDICFEPGVYIKRVRSNIKDRLDKATNRKKLIKTIGYDSKYGSHLIRLLSEAKDLLEFGELNFPLHNANLIKDIKIGKYKLEEVIKMAESLECDIDKIKDSSSLPSKSNYKEVEKFVIETLERHIGIDI
jgi:predicted nucleotidyltransferase